jgi:hypothetical protein
MCRRRIGRTIITAMAARTDGADRVGVVMVGFAYCCGP